MEGKYYSVRRDKKGKILQGVHDTSPINDIKSKFDITHQSSINDGLFIPSTAEFFSQNINNRELLRTKTVETDATNEFIGPSYIEPLNQSNEIGQAFKNLPLELKESLKRTFKSEALNTCFRPIHNRCKGIAQIPQTLDWSVYNKDHYINNDVMSSTSDGYRSDQTSIESAIEGTSLLEGPAIYARKYFTHRQDTIQSDVGVRERGGQKDRDWKKLDVTYVSTVPKSPKSPVTNYKIIVPIKSPGRSQKDQIASLQLDNLYSERPCEDVLIEQHTLREGYEIGIEEEQAHLDWLAMLRKTFIELRKDPNATRQQLRTIKHGLASGLGRQKWNRSDYYPVTKNSDPYDSDYSDSTYSSITVTSYESIVEQHTLSPSRIVLNEPCTKYNFFGDDPPLFHSEARDTLMDDMFDDNVHINTSNEYEFLGGNNFMHIKAYGWVELVPMKHNKILSYIEPYHQLYYEMRNNFIVLYYDNTFNIKSRFHRPCKVKQPGKLSKISKGYIHRKMNHLKYNEAIYDNKLKLFHFGDSGRGENVKHLLSRESFTPICAIILKGNYTFETISNGNLRELKISAQTIPLNRILWTRLKESDDDFFPAASFQSPRAIEKTFSRFKFRKKFYRSLINRVKEMITKIQLIDLTVMGVSHMEHDDLISKAVSRKRAFNIVTHLNSIKAPSFQHLSHFYNCPHLRELSLANIKFDEKFDRYIFETSVKKTQLNILDYRFRQINDRDLDVIIDYLSCNVEWMDLSNNNLVSGDRLEELVNKGNIKWLTLEGNHLPDEVVRKYSLNIPENDNLLYMQMRDRFLDRLDLQSIFNRSKTYSGRLATFQWGLVMFGKTKQLVLRSDFDKRIPENLLPLHYVYFELRGSYLMWFPNPLNKDIKKRKGKSIFQETFGANIKIAIHNIFHILDCAVVKRAGFKWLKVKATKPMKALGENELNSPFYLYLRGPTDSVTNTWMTFMAKLIAGQIYLNTCDKHAILPSRAILDHCWQPWSQRLILYGFPRDYEALDSFMGKLRRSLRLKYLNASNMKFDGKTTLRPFEQIKVMKLDFSFNNFSMSDESHWENVIDFCTKDVMTKEFVMDGNPLGDSIGSARFMHRAITSLTAHVIKFNHVDIGDVVGNELYNLFNDVYDSIGYVKVIELRGHNMSEIVLEKLLNILKERCPNLEEVIMDTTIARHIKIANNILKVMDTEYDKNKPGSLQVVGQFVHHRRVRKGKRTTRWPNIN